MRLIKSIERNACYNALLAFWNDAVAHKYRVYEDANGNRHQMSIKCIDGTPDLDVPAGYTRWNWQEWKAACIVLAAPVGHSTHGHIGEDWRNRQNRGWDNED